jgi:hypothetical protein
MKKLFLLLSLIFISGCGTSALMLAGPAIQGVIQWENGEAHKYYAYNSETMYRATKRALIKLDLPIIKDQVTGGGKFYIVGGAKSQYKLTIIPAEKNITDVGLRINFMGNHPQAELIYQNIDEQINTIVYDKSGKPN